jgi:hypothetical protein
MPDQLFIYSLENPLMIISINSWSYGGYWLLALGELVKIALKRDWEVGKGVDWGKDMGVAGFCRPCVCFGVYFCCSGGCLCQGLQGAGVVYSQQVVSV